MSGSGAPTASFLPLRLGSRRSVSGDRGRHPPPSDNKTATFARPMFMHEAFECFDSQKKIFTLIEPCPEIKYTTVPSREGTAHRPVESNVPSTDRIKSCHRMSSHGIRQARLTPHLSPRVHRPSSSQKGSSRKLPRSMPLHPGPPQLKPPHSHSSSAPFDFSKSFDRRA